MNDYSKILFFIRFLLELEFFLLDWQAQCRAHRIGQTKHVAVYKLFNKGTAEGKTERDFSILIVKKIRYINF